MLIKNCLKNMRLKLTTIVAEIMDVSTLPSEALIYVFGRVNITKMIERRVKNIKAYV